jgi:hypothetical protein
MLCSLNAAMFLNVKVSNLLNLLQVQVNGYGINSLADFFTDFGYVPREELRFPAKRLRALWFSPPNNDCYTGTGIHGPLPRIFISELLVDELTAQSQVIPNFLFHLATHLVCEKVNNCIFQMPLKK